MFNLLTTFDGSAWETDQLMRMEVDRFKESSEGPEAQTVSLDRPESLKLLEGIPSFLMYEQGSKGPTADIVRYGVLREIQVVAGELVFRFAEEARCQRKDIEEFATRLGVKTFEFNRTHWAVKDGGVPSDLLGRLKRPTTLGTAVNPIRFGMRIRLSHVETKAFLKSLKAVYNHAKSSGQQMVVATDQIDESTTWLVKGSTKQGDSFPIGTAVRRGDLVRLEHVQTRTNLHSHSAPSPIDGQQQEVSAFGVFGKGDPNDDWVVEPESGEFWLRGKPIRLVHNNTRRNLHSHAASHPSHTAGLQEVTAFGGKDERDYWVANLAGEEISAQSEASLTEGDYVEGPAGYTSEFCGIGSSRAVADHLGVDAQARRLAELIALRETELPLAVGLFGDWGSGKSHFMGLVDGHLKKLAAEPASQPEVAGSVHADRQSPWCKKIVPIYFNAWHYVDANLWASLVTQIFDGLYSHLRPKKDELALIQSRLKDAEGATARAEEEVVRAHEAVLVASRALDVARTRSESARQIVVGLLDNLGSLLPQINTPENRRRVSDWLGITDGVATLSELATKDKEMASIPGQMRELGRRVISRNGLWWRIGWLLGLLVISPFLLQLASDRIVALKDFLIRIGPIVQKGIAWLVAASLWITPLFASLKRQLAQMRAWQKQAEEAQIARSKNEDVKTAQEELSQAEATVIAAASDLAVAMSVETQLRQVADDMHPERRLNRFIESRAQSADYRGQLGLVSLARRDFHELSEIFADANALEKKAAGLPPAEAARLKNLGSSIDRIVLFVDDLDRCQPGKVVDVLQAVHLLLAFPLFAVVVGVDQRCLRQSLKTEFKGLLTSEPNEDHPGAASNRIDSEGRPATPLDYLEKVFHVPFHLPPMEEAGFVSLIEKMTNAPMAAETVNAGDKNTESRPDQSVQNAAPETEGPLPVTKAGEGPAESPTDTIQARRSVSSVPLTSWERAALKDYHSLIRTPRAATRFLNTYRLVRAGVLPNEWDSFRGDGLRAGEFRIAMLLLASAAGYPAVAREWFKILRNADPGALLLADDKEAIPEDWKRFKNLFDATMVHISPTPGKAVFGKWIDRVEQFAF